MTVHNMPTKLNSFILPDSVLQEMKRKVEYSRIKDIEIGFNLCVENGNLHDENPCTGTACAVEIPKGCIIGRHVGIFHTHPSASSEPSIQDILNAYQMGMNCIGSVKEKSIKCYIRKDAVPIREDLETILHLSKIPEKDIRNYKALMKVTDDLKKHYLNTIEII